MTLSDKLVILRKKEGLSQMEVSDKLNVSRQAVSRWESGVSKPSTENLQLLCKIYNVTIDYLLDESETELHVKAPAGPAPDCRQEQQEQENQVKRKLQIRWLVIGIVALVVLVSAYFIYENNQEENAVDLHEIQEQGDVSPEIPEFNLRWE